MNIKLASLLLLVTLIGHSCFSQSLVGTWKRVSTVLVDKNNVSNDLQKMMAKSLPCSVKLTYTFEASGIQKTNIPADCKKIMESAESMYADTKFEFNGKTLLVFSPKKELFPDATYQVTFQGNRMTWVHNFKDNPKDPNPTKTKSIKIVYEKL